MAEKENVALLKEAYEYWNENQEKAFQNWMDMLAEDVQFRSLADGHAGIEFTQTCHCKNDVLEYFQGLAREWAMIHYTIDEYIAEGDRVVAIGNCHWKNLNTGKDVETPKVDILTIKDSKIVDFFELYDTQRTIAATE